jgi:lipopolysaccharide export LptBFGC system permease protein LptF
VIRTLERYVFGELARTLAFTLVAITFVFFLGTTFRLTKDDLTYWQIARSLPYVIPYTLPYTLPMSFLVALTLTYGRLVADREVLALESCGVAPRSLAPSAIAIGLLLSLASLGLQARYLPYCHRRKNEIRRAALEQILSLGEGSAWSRVFPSEHFDIFVQHHSGPALSGVVIHREVNGEVVTITSERGKVSSTGGEGQLPSIVLELEDVTLTSFGRSHTGGEGPLRVRMASYVQEIPTLSGSRIRADDYSNGQLRERAKELAALVERLARDPATAPPTLYRAREDLRETAVELAARTASSLAPLVFLAIGLPLTLALRATNRLLPLVASVGAVSAFYFVPAFLGRALAERHEGWPLWGFLGVVVGSLAGAAIVPVFSRLERRSGGSLGRAWRRGQERVVAAWRSLGERIEARRSKSERRPWLSGAGLTLDRWIVGRFLVGYVAFFASILTVFVAADCLNKMDTFLDEHRPLVLAIADYYAAVLPEIYYVLAPFVTLAAALWVVFELKRHNELVPLMAAGIAPWRVCAPMVAAGVLLAGVMFADREVVVPAFASKRRANSDIERKQAFDVNPIPDRSGGILAARAYVPRSHSLHEASYTLLDPEGRESISAIASSAECVPGGWLFRDGALVRRETGSGEPRDVVETIPHAGRLFQSDIELLDVESSIDEITYLSTAEMERQYARIPAFKHLGVQLARRYSYPFSSVVLLLLGLPLVLRGDKAAAALGFLACTGLCALFFLATAFCEDLGTRPGGPPPALAVWLPNVAFGVPGLVAFLRSAR